MQTHTKRPHPSRVRLQNIRPSHKWMLVLLMALVLAMPATRSAQAGACCASAAAFGVGRLLRWEKFALGLRTTLINQVGRWDLQGQWQPKQPDYNELSWQSEFWGMVGLGKSVALYARFPWMLNHRSSGDLSEIGGSIGDIQAGVRWDILNVASHQWAPGIALTFNVLTPTGRATNTKQSTLGTSVTGRGAWILSAGLLLEKVRMPWFIQLQLGVGVPLPFHREDIDTTQRFGVSFVSALANGWEIIANTLVLSLVLRFSWEDNVQIGERIVANSHKLDIGALLALAWRFNPHWTLQLSVDTGIFASHLGNNENGKITTTLGLRYGFF